MSEILQNVPDGFFIASHAMKNSFQRKDFSPHFDIFIVIPSLVFTALVIGKMIFSALIRRKASSSVASFR